MRDVEVFCESEDMYIHVDILVFLVLQTKSEVLNLSSEVVGTGALSQLGKRALEILSLGLCSVPLALVARSLFSHND